MCIVLFTIDMDTNSNKKVAFVGDTGLENWSDDAFSEVVLRTWYNFADFTRDFKSAKIKVHNDIVCLVMGNNQIPMKEGENIGTQLKRLVPQIRKYRPLVKIFVSGLIPRGDHELELTPMVKAANGQLARACNDLRRFQGVDIAFIAIHKIFLERVKFKDPTTGKWCQQTRLLRPLDKYFRQGYRYLNEVGVAYLRSYLLSKMQVRNMVYPWTGIPKRTLMQNKEMGEEEDEGRGKDGDDSGSRDGEDSTTGESGEDEAEDSRLSERSEFRPESAAKRLKRTLEGHSDNVKVELKGGAVKKLIHSWESMVAKSAEQGKVIPEKLNQAEEATNSDSDSGDD